MKKTFYCLLATALLSACQQNEKLLCKVMYDDRDMGRMPDTTSMVYILPAETGHTVHIEKCIEYGSRLGNLALSRIPIESTVDVLRESIAKKGNSKIDDYDIAWLAESEKELAEKNAAIKILAAELKLLEDTAMMEIKNFNDNGTKKAIDNTGSCLFTLPPGKYQVLIRSKQCPLRRGILKEGRIYTANVTVEAKKENVHEQLAGCN